MKRSLRSLPFIFLIALGAPPVSADEIGSAIKDVPIFDAHIHYKEPAWEAYPVGTVIKLMDRAGVAMALVSSTPDTGTIRLWEYAPARIVPELRPYHGDAGSSNWTKAEGMLDYLKQRLAKYPHQGIGEFHIHDIDPSDRPLLTTVAAMAKARNIPIHIHSGAAPVKLFYELEPGLTILWAHAGMSEPAHVVGAMLDTYKTLYADTSYRENDILMGDGTIDPGWMAVIKRHSDRLMIGSDTWVNEQWDSYEELIDLNRQWLSKLPRPMAERIAYKNAAKLFRRSVSRTLIGKR
ncbi:MAG: amidohydrolase family protein [Rhodospirillaceae bacterium]|jgi:predicted TIM-barrel fold metal-dependent hydrolase|nr:amidohydrolase family protein [Rhodospirillaceae bacterium]MBT6430004.1 amidohydrolase family protein [Rhodospirillaceae bacterium]